MKADDPTIRVVDAVGEDGFGHARSLFRAYAAEYSPLVAVIFDVQGFDAEVAGLPGRYAPPSGCLLLAMDGDIAAGCVGLRDLGEGTCEMKRLYVPPSHRGRGVGASPYRQAHERGVKVIGATTRFVTAELDAGPIIHQDVAHVSHRDSVDDLVRIGREVERRVLAQAVRWHLEDQVLLRGGRTVVFE